MSNQIQIKDLKRGQRICSEDPDDWYVVFSNAELIDGTWQVDTTGSGDDIRIFKDPEVVFLLERLPKVKP